RLRAISPGNIYYGLDAFEGLRVLAALMAGQADELNLHIEDRLSKLAEVDRQSAGRQAAKAEREAAAADGGSGVATAEKVRSSVATDVPVSKPPFWGTRVIDQINYDDVVPFINKIALFRGQWQFKKGRLSDDA